MLRRPWKSRHEIRKTSRPSVAEGPLARSTGGSCLSARISVFGPHDKGAERASAYEATEQSRPRVADTHDVLALDGVVGEHLLDVSGETVCRPTPEMCNAVGRHRRTVSRPLRHRTLP